MALDVEDDGAIRWLTLQRPERLNAISSEMAADLEGQFHALRSTTATRVVILRGAGRGFCSGIDIKERGPGPGDDDRRHLLARQWQISAIVEAMRACPQPILALLHGPVVGLGLSLALAADLRIAAPDAVLDPAFVRIGLSGGDAGSSYFLPRLIGAGLARRILLTGRSIDAEESLRIGLVSEVVADHHSLAPAAQRLARDMLRCSPIGLALTKDLLNRSEEATSLSAHLGLENRSQVICSLSGETAEGRAARTEGREPSWFDRPRTPLANPGRSGEPDDSPGG